MLRLTLTSIRTVPQIILRSLVSRFSKLQQLPDNLRTIVLNLRLRDLIWLKDNWRNRLLLPASSAGVCTTSAASGQTLHDRYCGFYLGYLAAIANVNSAVCGKWKWQALILGSDWLTNIKTRSGFVPAWPVTTKVQLSRSSSLTIKHHIPATPKALKLTRT